MVQMWAHPPARADDVRQAAREADAGAVRRGSRTLEIDIVEGKRLTIELLTPGLEVEEPVQSLIWRARPESVQFLVTAPADHAECDVFGTVRVAVDSVPVGHVKFVLTVVGTAASWRAGAAPEATGRAHSYRSAFISYARRDRNAVLQRVQMLEPFGIDYFQDILDLRPGDQYEGLIFQRIDACDLFLLFWSTAARESEWVMKEVRRALVRKAGDDEAPPEICPVIIEGPPAPPPPPELAHLHFDDRLLYFMRP